MSPLVASRTRRIVGSSGIAAILAALVGGCSESGTTPVDVKAGKAAVAKRFGDSGETPRKSAPRDRKRP